MSFHDLDPYLVQDAKAAAAKAGLKLVLVHTSKGSDLWLCDKASGVQVLQVESVTEIDMYIDAAKGLIAAGPVEDLPPPHEVAKMLDFSHKYASGPKKLGAPKPVPEIVAMDFGKAEMSVMSLMAKEETGMSPVIKAIMAKASEDLQIEAEQALLQVGQAMTDATIESQDLTLYGNAYKVPLGGKSVLIGGKVFHPGDVIPAVFIAKSKSAAGGTVTKEDLYKYLYSGGQFGSAMPKHTPGKSPSTVFFPGVKSFKKKPSAGGTNTEPGGKALYPDISIMVTGPPSGSHKLTELQASITQKIKEAMAVPAPHLTKDPFTKHLTPVGVTLKMNSGSTHGDPVPLMEADHLGARVHGTNGNGDYIFVAHRLHLPQMSDVRVAYRRAKGTKEVTLRVEGYNTSPGLEDRLMASGLLHKKGLHYSNTFICQNALEAEMIYAAVLAVVGVTASLAFNSIPN